MMRSLQLMAIGLAMLPATARAQTLADRDYCGRLGTIYEHYLGRSYAASYDDYRRGPLSAQVAVGIVDFTAAELRAIETAVT